MIHWIRYVLSECGWFIQKWNEIFAVYNMAWVKWRKRRWSKKNPTLRYRRYKIRIKLCIWLWDLGVYASGEKDFTKHSERKQWKRWKTECTKKNNRRDVSTEWFKIASSPTQSSTVSLLLSRILFFLCVCACAFSKLKSPTETRNVQNRLFQWNTVFKRWWAVVGFFFTILLSLTTMMVLNDAVQPLIHISSNHIRRH